MLLIAAALMAATNDKRALASCALQDLPPHD